MKSVTLKILVLFFSIFVGCSSIPSRPDKLGLEPVEFSYEAPLRWELDNGLIVYYLYNEELPQISGTLYLRGGSYYESKRELGHAAATGSQMRNGGTTKITPGQLDTRLDSLGAMISSGFDGEFGTVSFYSLTSDFEEVFSYFEEVIRSPRFDSSRFELWKNLSKEGIRRRKDDPATIAAMTFAQLLYGAEHPQAVAARSSDVDKITIGDMKRFHSTYVRPNGSILAVTGDIPVEEFKKKVAAHFADWPKNNRPIAPLTEVTSKLQPGIYLATREFNQATVLIGHRGPDRLSPDMYVSRIFSTAFGHGSFSSVLFEEIRTRLGLAYSAYGGFEGGANSGEFQIYLATRVSQVPLAFKESVRLVKEARSELPNKSRFNNAKDSVERSYVFRFADSGAIVTRAALLELLGYEKEFDKFYLDNIRGVTREAVKEFAEREIDPESLVTVIVGNVTEEQLRKELGEELPIYRVRFDEVPVIDFESVTDRRE